MLGRAVAYAVQEVPLTEMLTLRLPLETAANAPPAPTPVYSIAVTAPVVELTAVIVIVISLVVVAPPSDVPNIVIVFSLAYPVPAASMFTARYLIPLRTTVNVAPLPVPLVVPDTGEYTA